METDRQRSNKRNAILIFDGGQDAGEFFLQLCGIEQTIGICVDTKLWHALITQRLRPLSAGQAGGWKGYIY
ncbi:MAG: hypothetical protein NWQ88_00425 [Aquiluna sp.]|nr:hypothetical protein [Aquiluna sp.]